MPTPNVALRTLRLRADLSVRELARKADLDPSTVSRIESGSREGTYESLSALAAALGVDAERLGGISRPVAS